MGLLVFTLFLVIAMIAWPKVIYAYIGALFVMLLGLSFFIIKMIDNRKRDHSIPENSIFEQDEEEIEGFAYFFLAMYLIIFPILLFQPEKLKTAVRILGQMYSFYSTMYTVNLLSLLVGLLTWGMFLAELFILVMFITAGSPKIESNSFFYLYSGVELSHPVVIVFQVLGMSVFFVSLLSWHKYFISTAMCLWYF